jgi:hypothetical protein
MARGVATFASAIFASAIAAAPLACKAQDATEATAPDKPAASDDCLTAPNGGASQGQHWFYRTEHGSQRHCWYLRDRPERVSQPAATPATIPTTKPPARTGEAAVPRAAAPAARPSADARAELPGGARGRFENDGAVGPRLLPSQAMAARAAATVAADDDVRAAQGTSSLSQSLDTFAAPPPSAEASAAVPDAGADANATPDAVSAPAAMPTADVTARTDGAPPKTSLQKLLVVIFSALAFAGVTASLTHRLARVWRKRAVRLRRHMMWKPARAVRSRSALASMMSSVASGPTTPAAPPNQPDDAQIQIEELLSRAAKQVKRPAPALAKSRAAAAARGQRSSARRGARA